MSESVSQSVRVSAINFAGLTLLANIKSLFTHLDGIHKLLKVVAIPMQRVVGGEEGDGLATLVQQHWAGGWSQTSTGKEINDETAWEEIRHGDNKEHSLPVPHLVFVCLQ